MLSLITHQHSFSKKTLQSLIPYLFLKYIEIMKGLYIVRTVSLFYLFYVFYYITFLFFSPSWSRRFVIAPHLPITIVVMRKHTLPITVPFIFSPYVVNPKLKVLQMQRTFSQYRTLLKRRSTCRLEILRSHITQTSLHKSSGKRRLN